MSDFSTITIAREVGMFPEAARTGEWFQSKDMPDDDEWTYCISGEIDTEGRFIREDTRGRFWNPMLNGWIGILGEISGIELLCCFVDGRVVEVRPRQGESIEDGSPLRGAYWSPNNWVAI